MIVSRGQSVSTNTVGELRGEPCLLAPLERDRRQPLADDVTVEELAARPKQPKAPRKESSTAQYAKTSNKWWPAFLKHAGWDGTVKGNFLDEAGKPIDGTFRQLFIWLYEQDVTKGVYKPMLALSV